MTQFPLRLPDHIMEQARSAASEDKVSVNQLLLAFIAEGLGNRRGLRAVRQRAARADTDAALALLDGIRGVDPERGDQLPVRPRSRGAK